MADSAGRTDTRPHSRLTDPAPRPAERRHPLVAAAIVLPLALVLAVLFGAVEVMADQAWSVAVLLGN